MAQVLEHQSQDVDDQAKSLTGWQQVYEQLGCGRFRGSAWQVVMTEGVLLRESTNRQLREFIVPPPGHLVLALPLSVEPGSKLCGRAIGPESMMVLGHQQEYDLVTAGELDLVGISLHRDVLEAALGPAKVEWLNCAERERVLDLTLETATAIRHMLLAACTEAERHVDALVETAAESELLSSTLSHAVVLAMAGDKADHSSTIPRRADTRMRVVKRAIEFMRGNLSNDVGIPEICGAAFASRRTLQYCFEEFMHTTPQAYLRALRLNEARRTLKTGGDQPITSVASTLGFSSASHFTRHYKLMFDELPSETMKINYYGQMSP